MQREIKLSFGDILTEDTHYILYRAVHEERNVVALVIKMFTTCLFEQINVCKESLSASNNSSLLKIIDAVSDFSEDPKTIVIFENFSNTSYEIFAKNNMKLSQRDILNHAITLSASCASLVTQGYFPSINFETICFDNEGALKLIHPHLIDTIHMVVIEKTNADFSKPSWKIQLLFRAPEAFQRHFQKNEASSVYQFGLFLLYSTLGNLDFMNKSDDEIIEIASSGDHPAIPAHCPADIAAIIKKCLQPAGRRPGFAEIRDEVLSIKTKQSQQAVNNIQQKNDSLFSRIPKEVIATDVMKAIQAYGVFTISDKSQPEAIDNSNNNTAKIK